MFNNHWSGSVHHDGSARYVTPNVGHTLGSTVTLRLRADREAPIERVLVRTSPNGEQRMTAMQAVQTDGVCSWWEVELQLRVLRTNYRFLLLTAEGAWWLTAAGMLRYTPTDATDFKILARYAAPTLCRLPGLTGGSFSSSGGNASGE